MAESPKVLLGSSVAMAPASPLGAGGIASFEGSSVEVAPSADAAVALSATVLLVAAGFWLLRQGRDRA